MSNGVWFTDKLENADGSSAFAHPWGFGAAAPQDHSTSDTLDVAADKDGELWTVRDSLWKPVSALGYGFTRRTTAGNTQASPAVIGVVESNDALVSYTPVASGVANVGQIPAAASVTLNASGLWLVWLYVYTAAPTDTTPSASISVSGTTIAAVDYPAAAQHISLSGVHVASASGGVVTFVFPSADIPDVIRTACIKISDYEA